ncbi:MAG: MBL fold metallo-hydrolase RNA specificity domain-containing protein, partial [Armatimonadota bacterium]
TEITSRLRAWCAGLRPDVLITEGTRIVDGNGRTLSSSGDDEAGVESRITDIVRDCAGLVIVDFGWKDTARLRTIVAVAKSTGRTLVVNPKVAYLWALLGKDDPNSYPDFESVGNLAVYLERLDSMTYSLADYSGSKHTVGVCLDWGEKNKDMRQAFLAHDNEYLRDRLCHYYSGIRAYDIAADPARFIVHAGFFDMNELFDIAPPPGSVFISAMTEPFCDEMEIDQRKLKNWLDYFGIDYGGDRIQHYHVSGHANGQDLLDFIRSVEPKLVVPVHTEHPEAFVRELVGFDVHLPEYGRPFSCP